MTNNNTAKTSNTGKSQISHIHLINYCLIYLINLIVIDYYLLLIINHIIFNGIINYPYCWSICHDLFHIYSVFWDGIYIWCGWSIWHVLFHVYSVVWGGVYIWCGWSIFIYIRKPKSTIVLNNLIYYHYYYY